MSDDPSDEATPTGQIIFFRCTMAAAIGIYAILTFFMISSIWGHWTGRNVVEGRDLLSIPSILGPRSEGSRYDSSSP